ncbi:hypothetical protein JL722_11916 [Aureococcus anophagefferens]|nr:hypothetical protein JL722_11916 [Aureococcus anophagefferens]
MRASWTPLGAPAYGSVLVVGDVTILLDCGCDVGFEEACFERIGAVAKDVDLVLISHHELRHLGALAAAKARYGLRAPIYATLPVTKLGFVTMYEAWAGYRASFGRDAARSKFTLDDVDAAFGKMRPLKFDQPLSLRGKGAGVVITAHRCGHSVGGAYWRVRLGADDIVYCVDAHHADERHVAGAALSTSAETRRPAVFITDCGAVARDVEASKDKTTTNASRPAAEDALVTAALEALRRGGHCLVPADCGSRASSSASPRRGLAVQRLGGAYDLVFVHSMAKNVLDFARSQIEWMCGDAQKAFDGVEAPLGPPLALRELDAAVAAKRARLEAARAEADLRRRAEEMARGVLLLEDEDGGAVDLDDDDDDAAGDVGLEGPAGDGRDGGRRGAAHAARAARDDPVEEEAPEADGADEAAAAAAAPRKRGRAVFDAAYDDAPSDDDATTRWDRMPVDLDDGAAEKLASRGDVLGDGFDVSRVFSAVLVDDDGAKATKLVLDSELLEAADADGAGAAPSKLWLSARDVVLPALKEKLAAEGVKAVFKAGSLVCDGAIVVRKAADDRGNAQLVVDGPLCPESYAVSRLVQSAFSLV